MENWHRSVEFYRPNCGLLPCDRQLAVIAHWSKWLTCSLLNFYHLPTPLLHTVYVAHICYTILTQLVTQKLLTCLHRNPAQEKEEEEERQEEQAGMASEENEQQWLRGGGKSREGM